MCGVLVVGRTMCGEISMEEYFELYSGRKYIENTLECWKPWHDRVHIFGSTQLNATFSFDEGI